MSYSERYTFLLNFDKAKQIQKKDTYYLLDNIQGQQPIQQSDLMQQQMKQNDYKQLQLPQLLIKLNQKQQILFVMKIKQTEYNNLEAEIQNQSKNQILQSCRYSNPTQIKIKQGEIIHFGRVKFLNICISNYITDMTILDEDNYQKNKYYCSICKQFCQLYDQEQFNILVKGCICTGQIKYVHLHCLSNYVLSDIEIKEIKNISITSIKSKNYFCQICKQEYNCFFLQNNSVYSILDYFIENWFSQFILMSIDSKQYLNSKDFHIINYANINQQQQYVVGRGKDSDIQIIDKCVSRNHSTLWIQNDNMIIQASLCDNHSKFGTFLELFKHKYVKLKQDQMTAILYQNQLLQLCIKEYEMNI